MAATLRPETMYGQTNCWALPTGTYGAFQGPNNEVYIMAHRAARNLSYQARLPETGKPELLLNITGQDLFGVPLSVSPGLCLLCACTSLTAKSLQAAFEHCVMHIVCRIAFLAFETCSRRTTLMKFCLQNAWWLLQPLSTRVALSMMRLLPEGDSETKHLTTIRFHSITKYIISFR